VVFVAALMCLTVIGTEPDSLIHLPHVP
jgi:hypothetical protein